MDLGTLLTDTFDNRAEVSNHMQPLEVVLE